jgi:hypothetical protein
MKDCLPKYVVNVSVLSGGTGTHSIDCQETLLRFFTR